jgi:hypothetical protein
MAAGRSARKRLLDTLANVVAVAVRILLVLFRRGL